MTGHFYKVISCIREKYTFQYVLLFSVGLLLLSLESEATCMTCRKEPCVCPAMEMCPEELSITAGFREFFENFLLDVEGVENIGQSAKLLPLDSKAIKGAERPSYCCNILTLKHDINTATLDDYINTAPLPKTEVAESRLLMFKCRLLNLLYESPESAFTDNYLFNDTDLFELFNSEENILPQLESVLDSSFLVVLKKALAGILLLSKKNKSVTVELVTIEQVVKTEQFKHAEQSASYHLLSFLLHIAQHAHIPWQVQAARQVEPLVDMAIATGYYPSLFYAVRMLNGGIDGIREAYKNRRKSSGFQALIQKIHYALGQTRTRIGIVVPERLTEARVLELLYSGKQAALCSKFEVVYFSCLQEQLADISELEESEAFGRLKKLLQFYRYKLAVAPDNKPAQQPVEMKVVDVGSFMAVIGDSVQDMPALLQNPEASQAVRVIKRRLSEQKKHHGLKPYCAMLIDSCSEEPQLKKKHYYTDILLNELSPSGIYNRKGASVHAWSQTTGIPGAGYRHCIDAPLLHYPEYPEYDLWPDLLEMHAASLDREYDDLTMQHFTQLALFFVKPRWKDYRRLFFNCERQQYQDPGDIHDYFAIVPADESQLSIYLEIVIDQVLRGHNNNFCRYSLLDEYPLREMASKGYTLSEHPACLFICFIKSVMHAAYFYRSSSLRNPIEIIEPILEVVRQGYLPGIDIINGMLEPASGLFDDGARSMVELRFPELLSINETRQSSLDVQPESSFQSKDSAFVRQLGVLLSTHNYIGEAASGWAFDKIDQYSLLRPSDKGYMKAHQLAEISLSIGSSKEDIAAYTSDHVAYSMVQLLLDRPEKALVQDVKYFCSQSLTRLWDPEYELFNTALGFIPVAVQRLLQRVVSGFMLTRAGYPKIAEVKRLLESAIFMTVVGTRYYHLLKFLDCLADIEVLKGGRVELRRSHAIAGSGRKKDILLRCFMQFGSIRQFPKIQRQSLILMMLYSLVLSKDYSIK